MTDSPEAEEAISRAKSLVAEYNEAKERYERLTQERHDLLIELNGLGVSWAEIGRIYGVSPTAAKYASGLVKRSTKKSGSKSKKKGGA